MNETEASQEERSVDFAAVLGVDQAETLCLVSLSDARTTPLAWSTMERIKEGLKRYRLETDSPDVRPFDRNPKAAK